MYSTAKQIIIPFNTILKKPHAASLHHHNPPAYTYLYNLSIQPNHELAPKTIL